MTTIFLDYDDTIFPTSYLTNLTNKNIFTAVLPLVVQLNLVKLDQLVVAYLQHLEKQGKLIIVTNATMSWVKDSSFKFLPMTYAYLKRVTIVSAADAYQEAFPEKKEINGVEWKLHSMKKYAKGRIISIGDSEDERNACIQLRSKFDVKIIKLRQFPTLEFLIQEILALTYSFKTITMTDRTFS